MTFLDLIFLIVFITV